LGGELCFFKVKILKVAGELKTLKSQRIESKAKYSTSRLDYTDNKSRDRKIIAFLKKLINPRLEKIPS